MQPAAMGRRGPSCTNVAATVETMSSQGSRVKCVPGGRGQHLRLDCVRAYSVVRPSHQKIYCAPGMPTALMACSSPSRVIWAGSITRIDKRIGSRDSGKRGGSAAIYHRAENPAEAWKHVGLTLPLSSNPSARLALLHVGQWLCCFDTAEGGSLATPFAALECGCGSLGGREATPAH